MKPDIFGYHDYRAFLRAWVEHRKATQSKFSLRFLSKQAGFSTGYLPMVLGDKRPLTADALAKLQPHLGLTASEESFFEDLVVLETAQTHESRVAAVERMKRFQQYQKLNPNETQVYDYLRHWYYVAIREMAALDDFRNEAEWIQGRLRFAVPLKEVKEALRFLFENKYLEFQADGAIKKPDRALDCSGGIYRLALGQYHREIFTLAEQSIEAVPRAERSIMGHTVALSSDGFEKAQEIVERALAQLREVVENDKSSNAVYHMEIALFPLIKPTKES